MAPLDSLAATVRGLWTPALALLGLALWLNRREPRAVLAMLRPASLRVNATAFAVDALLIAGPMALLTAWLFLNTPKLPLQAFWAGLPEAVTLIAAVFVGDFIAYWRHRLEHSRILWPSHVLHHSDTAMNWTTVYRFHPINRLTTVFFDFGLLLAAGFPAGAAATNAVFRHFYGIFIHINQPWTLGPLRHVLVSPAMHRWHHVKEGAGVGCNFASVFSVFDRLLGTYYVPGPCNSPLGVPDVNHQSYWSQLWLPVVTAARWIRAATAQ